MAWGPTLIFDKSALQALSLDEAVWLDHYFLSNVTPVFFVETLADLEKVHTSMLSIASSSEPIVVPWYHPASSP